MKTPFVILIAVGCGVAAFFAGRSGAAASDAGSSNQHANRAPSVDRIRPGMERDSVSHPNRRSSASLLEKISRDDIARLSSEEKLRLIREGSLVFNGGNQLAVMLELISSLTKDEIAEAVHHIAASQNGGNIQAQEIWDTVWKQWGKVDPEGCFAVFADQSSYKSPSDARNVMQGWYETDPQAALEWAKLPRISLLETTAAALALSLHAEGDPDRLRESILSLPSDSNTVVRSMRDYYDLTSLRDPSRQPAEIYDELPESLKKAGWRVTLDRINFEDTEKAAQWISKHANDPGRSYLYTGRVVSEMIRKDAAKAAEWAASLPYSLQDSQGIQGDHPAFRATREWMRKDPETAKAWLEQQATQKNWARDYLEKHVGTH